MASYAVEFVLSKLGEFISNKATSVLGLKDEIEFVKIKLEFLRLFLADADQKRRHKQHESVRVWVNQLREVAYDLEDVLDEYAVVGASPWEQWGIASRIRKIKATLEEIASNKAAFLDPIDLSSSSQDSSTVDARINKLRTEVEAEPTGQNTYVEKLMPQILNYDAQRHCIISICGMGGLGKTTLAKRLYNDKKVKSHFNLHAWLTISQTFNIIDLLKRLMKELYVEGDTSNEYEMKRKLKDHLRKKRFIIVLDDMWDINAWDSLKTIFPEEHEGITVLLTTRDKNLATDVNPESEPFELQLLKLEESWQLFCRKAFVDANCPENFQEFKEEVIKRSKGLPLAVIVLGGLLRKYKDPYQWRKVLDHKRWGKDEVESILCLSYDYLPHHLKACFIYVAGYPEDYKIDAKELMLIWIAEGFIKKQQGQTMEDSAEDFLEELIQRSLIQLVERDEIERVSVIRVHDLLLDMAQNEAQEINFLHLNTSQQSSTLVRRLSICGKDDIPKHLNDYPTSKLRSILCIVLEKEVYVEYFDFRSTKFLRVLSLQGIKFASRKCPEAIGNLIQLKYLSFGESLTYLPNNISNLQNLQTLDISRTEVEQLPKKFWEIASLRHVIGGLYLRINPHVNKMKELQTLRGISNYKWIIEDGLHKLSNIRTLCMRRVLTHESQNIDIEKLEEKLIDAIENLKNLTSLELWEEFASKKVLTVSNSTLRHLELWKGKIPSGEQQHNRQKYLPNLSWLKLYGITLTQDDIHVIGLLPNLKSLTIEEENKLTKLVFKEGYFSRLEVLTLHLCRELKSWQVKENSSKSIKQLQHVFIGWCPKLKLLPHPQVLKIKEIRGDGICLRHEVALWAKQMSESPNKTVVSGR